MILAAAVPATLLLALFRRTLVALWQAPLVQQLRQAHWSLRVAALLVLALVTAYGGSKGGSSNAQNNASGGSAKPGGTPIDSGIIISRTDTTKLLEAMTANIQQGRPATQGLQIREADGSVAPVPLFQALVPDWYFYSAQDSDQDGIPDLWEIWTHGDPMVHDSGLDRDGDGVTDLYEFWNQTDPRTADTDGDGLSDYEEIELYKTNPLVKQDFTVEEPDENEGGIIDLWEGSGYLYGFVDTNNDGFDDRYAGTMPPLSEAWYDVLVEVVSSRSAALVWDNAGDSGGIVLTACPNGQLVRLRLPFEADTSLRLLPAPEGADPPGGEPWKARLKVSFAPHGDQGIIGNSIVTPDGGLIHNQIDNDRAIVFFPHKSGIQTFGTGSPLISTQLIYYRFGITPMEPGWHFVGELIGPFAVTNSAGAPPQYVSWFAENATVSAEPGENLAFIVVTDVSELDNMVRLSAISELDPATIITNRISIPPCPQRSFALDEVTGNFSPHLEEVAYFSVILPGCQHRNDPGWLEAEILRVTVGDTQQVAWVDMDAAQAGLNRWVDTTSLSSMETFSWDGLAQVNLPLADHPDVFVGPKGFFNRAMPKVENGEPVPPPFYTLAVRLLSPDKSCELHSAERRIYVPQVVNLLLFGGETTFQESIDYTIEGATPVSLYEGCSANVASNVLAQLPQMAAAFFPSDVNLRIVSTNNVKGAFKSMVIVGETHGTHRGDTSDFSKRNEKAHGNMAIYISSFRRTLRTNYRANLKHNYDSIPLPMTPELFAKYIAPTVTHEIGHSLGLVDPDWLEATPDTKQRRHNLTLTRYNMMDQGGLFFVKHRLNPHSTAYWKSENLRYLRFVLPSGGTP